MDGLSTASFKVPGQRNYKEPNSKKWSIDEWDLEGEGCGFDQWGLEDLGLESQLVDRRGRRVCMRSMPRVLIHFNLSSDIIFARVAIVANCPKRHVVGRWQ